ncbi:MAG: hypothetical protein Q8O52_00140 [Sulfuritalea sp.]|nr:hypothetical protein [Sulfuritalea sp.]
MKEPGIQTKPQPATTAKVITMQRQAGPVAPAGSAPTGDPRRNYFADSNGSRWGRNFRSN